jgi:dihydroneopterin aldolase
MDTIFLSEVRAETRLGVPEWERMVPHSRSCQTDAIEDTIDYGRVVTRIRETLKEHSFRLVEALAEHVCQLILQEFGAPRVRVKVSKPGILPGLKALGVIIERQQ